MLNDYLDNLDEGNLELENVEYDLQLSNNTKDDTIPEVDFVKKTVEPVPHPVEESHPVPPVHDTSVNYCMEAMKLYRTNLSLSCMIQNLMRENKGLLSRITVLEEQRAKEEALVQTPQKQSKKKQKKRSKKKDRLRKRRRRSASEIERLFKCPYPACAKAYGSDNSLNQHKKLKHLNEPLPASYSSTKESSPQSTTNLPLPTLTHSTSLPPYIPKQPELPPQPYLEHSHSQPPQGFFPSGSHNYDIDSFLEFMA